MYLSNLDLNLNLFIIQHELFKSKVYLYYLALLIHYNQIHHFFPIESVVILYLGLSSR